VHGFYRDTLTTLDRSWLRPRHQGYLTFQVDGSRAIDRVLDGSIGAADAAKPAFCDVGHSRPAV